MLLIVGSCYGLAVSCDESFRMSDWVSEDFICKRVDDLSMILKIGCNSFFMRGELGGKIICAFFWVVISGTLYGKSWEKSANLLLFEINKAER